MKMTKKERKKERKKEEKKKNIPVENNPKYIVQISPFVYFAENAKVHVSRKKTTG